MKHKFLPDLFTVQQTDLGLEHKRHLALINRRIRLKVYTFLRSFNSNRLKMGYAYPVMD